MNNIVISKEIKSNNKFVQAGDVFTIENVPYIVAWYNNESSMLFSLESGNYWGRYNLVGSTVEEALNYLRHDIYDIEYLGPCNITIEKKES